jgi:dTMP kinase
MAKFIKAYLEKKNIKVTLTREPGGTELAEAIRKISLMPCEEELLPDTELMLMFAARLQHVEHKIKPALARGEWVVCDRFVDSSYAYQGAGRGISIHKISEIQHWTLGDFKPDLTLVLDAPVALGFTRIEARKEKDRIEQEGVDFFERVRKTFLNLAQAHPDTYRVINAQKSLEEVQKDAMKILDSLC